MLGVVLAVLGDVRPRADAADPPLRGAGARPRVHADVRRHGPRGEAVPHAALRP